MVRYRTEYLVLEKRDVMVIYIIIGVPFCFFCVEESKREQIDYHDTYGGYIGTLP